MAAGANLYHYTLSESFNSFSGALECTCTEHCQELQGRSEKTTA